MQTNADGSLSELHTRTNESGIDLTSDSRLVTAWNDIRTPKHPTRWSLCTYQDGGVSASSNGTELCFVASGEGGMSQLTTHLRPQDVNYGVLLCRVGLVSKPVFITWVGPDVSPTYRGRVSMHKQGVRNFYIGCCCEIFATDFDDLSVETTTTVLCKATTEIDCSVEDLIGSGVDVHTAALQAAQEQESPAVCDCEQEQ